MSSCLPILISGYWSGSVHKQQQQQQQQPLCVVLCVRQAAKPTAFGVLVKNQQKEGQKQQVVEGILHGEWHPQKRSVSLEQINFTKDPPYYKYTAHLTQHNSTWILQGKRFSEIGSIVEDFALIKEDDDPSIHCSGLWLGQAIPDPSLDLFMIPTNPIQWCMSVIIPDSQTTSPIIGCGFFDDSADIPNQPLIFYSLNGITSKGDNLINISITKKYEKSEQTEGYAISYTGTLEKGDDHTVWLRGKWDNPKGGSFGTFSCRLQPACSTASHITLCQICNVPVQPGESRWTCIECLTPWSCCTLCKSTQEHHHELSPEVVCDLIEAKGACCAEIVANAFKIFSPRPFLGIRHPSCSSYHFLTYGEIEQATVYLFHALCLKGCLPGNFVLICADLCPSYVVCMLAVLLLGAVILPIHGDLDMHSISHIICNTSPSVCVVQKNYTDKILQAFSESQTSLPKIFIEVNPDIPTSASPVCPPGEPFFELSSSPSGGSSNLYSLSCLLSLGKSILKTTNNYISSVTVNRLPLEHISAILFTSGSTGVPKGAMFTEELLFPSEGLATIQPFVRLDFQTFDPSFIMSILQTMQCGGQRAFARLETLMEDIKIARPTHLGATPLFWNSLHQDYVEKVSSLIQEQETLEFQKSHSEIAKNVGFEIKQQLGNRLHVATTGGAPISAQVLQWAKSTLRLDITDLYGSRETGGIARDGVVYPAVKLQLLSIPELGYFNDSIPPQGEICVHSPRLIPGYWNDDVNSKAFITLDGEKYYRTGDVGELVSSGEVQRIRVIDRCSNFLKLSQGEWVSPGKVETVIESNSLVQHALVLGSSSHSFLVAVVVPSRNFKLFWESSPRDEQKHQNFTYQLRDELRFWCSHHHLRPIEIPQVFYLERHCWTTQNGLLTPTEKKRRTALLIHYRDVLEQLYQGSTNSTSAPLSALNTNSISLSPIFMEILQKVMPFNVPQQNLPPFSTVQEIGVDSISATKLLHHLRQHKVYLNLTALFQYPLAHISAMVEKAKCGYTVPAPIEKEVDWNIEWSLPFNLKQNHTTKQEHFHSGHVLVTGCTGFLGTVLVSEILKQYSPEIIVYCLIRAQKNTVEVREQQYQRLKRDMERFHCWDPKHAHRIHLLPGNLEDSTLLLGAERYQQLSQEIGHIFHCGAAVNHIYPYNTLKPANVGGTLALLHLLHLGGNKARFHFISTIGAIPGSTHSTPSEDWVNLSVDQMNIKDGYGQSKAVAERLLNEYSQQLQTCSSFKTPITVFRPSTISTHQLYPFTNKKDFINLLISACVYLKCVPERATIQLGLIPVDFVAKSIVELALSPPQDQDIFHLCGDGPTLQSIFSSLRERGYLLVELPIEKWRSHLDKLPLEHPAYPFCSLLERMNFSANNVEKASSSTLCQRTKAALESRRIAWFSTPNDFTLLIEALITCGLISEAAQQETLFTEQQIDLAFSFPKGLNHPNRGDCFYNGALSSYSIFSSDDPERSFVLSSLSGSCLFESGLNRAVGAMYGMVIGDALGAPLEFQPVQYNKVFLTGFDDASLWSSSVLNIKPGQWTDDSSLGFCLADSLLCCKGFNPQDLRLRFLNWWDFGYNNAFGRDFKRGSKASAGLGGNINQSFSEFRQKHNEYTLAGDKFTSGNGSLMRLAGVPIFYALGDMTEAMSIAARQSKTTHQGDEAAACCQLLTYLIIRAINGVEKHVLLGEEIKKFSSKLYSVSCLARSVAEGKNPENECLNLDDRNWNWKNPHFRWSERRVSKDAGYIGSYAMDALAMALHCVWTTTTLTSALLKAANLRGDSDTLCAITGQLAGSLYGFSKFPKEWVEKVNQWEVHDGDIGLRAYKLYRCQERCINASPLEEW